MTARTGVNVHGVERAASAVVGALMVRAGLRRLSLGRMVMAAGGAALVYRGATGHCPVYQRLGVATAGELAEGGVRVRRAITVQLPVEEVSRRLREFERMPHVLDRLESCEREADGTYRWRLREGGRLIECRTRITQDRAGEGFAWQSLPGSDLRCDGDVRLQHATGRRGTEVLVDLAISPPGGRAAGVLAPLLRRVARHQLGAELHRIKQLMETGEIATNAMRPTKRLEAPAERTRTELPRAQQEVMQ